MTSPDDTAVHDNLGAYLDPYLGQTLAQAKAIRAVSLAANTEGGPTEGGVSVTHPVAGEKGPQ